VEQREGHTKYQHDLAVTLRFDLTLNWLLKLEAHSINGTAGLENRDLNGLNRGVEAEELTRRWAVFLLKTTAYF
jgi:hypothetical protein